jgi:hypothetical protein
VSKKWQEVQNELWAPLKPLTWPTSVGRRLDVGGFVLGDSFDTFLTHISEDYLHARWTRLSSFLEQHRIEVSDLTWGWMHNGETGFEGESYEYRQSVASPMDFIGWTSCELCRQWSTYEVCNVLDNELKSGSPPLRCTMIWRSLKWSIEPQDYQTALKLIEAICSDPVEWHADFLLQFNKEPTELWRLIAASIRDNDQKRCDALIEKARQTYSPLGFRMLLRGYNSYTTLGGLYEGEVTVPEPSF